MTQKEQCAGWTQVKFPNWHEVGRETWLGAPRFPFPIWLWETVVGPVLVQKALLGAWRSSDLRIIITIIILIITVTNHHHHHHHHLLYQTCDVLACSASILHLMFISLGRYRSTNIIIITQHIIIMTVIMMRRRMMTMIIDNDVDDDNEADCSDEDCLL